MKKKLISLVLISVMAFSTVACGSSTAQETSTQSSESVAEENASLLQRILMVRSFCYNALSDKLRLGGSIELNDRRERYEVNFYWCRS
jgi:hypothetical protein